jgi:anti-sigma factor RsiW
MTRVAARRARCLDLLAELSSYIDGELSAARCRQIERHLEACPCCDHLAARLRRAVLVCRQAGQRQLPRAVRQRARERVEALLDGVSAEARPAPRTVTHRSGSRSGKT